MPTKPLPSADLAHILTHARASFESLRDARLFITGGTGFFGHWLLESLLFANRELSLNVRATVLTRSADAFRVKSPHIATDPAITLLEGDIRTFPFPTEPHTHILHAATDSGGQQTALAPGALAASILEGTQRVLNFARMTGAPGPDSRTREGTTHKPIRFLYTSTGAVYGRSTTLLHTPESYLETHTPQLPPDSYEAAKREAELLCLNFASSLAPGPWTLAPVIARCFAFVGPHLPLDQHFAIGNFLNAAIHNQPIHIKGDGTPRRSWLYMADLAIWLWTLLTQATPGTAYNVGSDEAYTIAEAAHLVQKVVILSAAKDLLLDNAPIQIDGTPNPAAPLNSYVPDINRAHYELDLDVTIRLREALRRTAAWHTQP